MEVQHIAITTPTGLSLMQFIIDDENMHRDPTIENIEAEIVRSFGELLPYRLIELSDIPTDREYRGAWVDTGLITFDMVKAREIHREKIREARVPKLMQLDIDYMKADEQNNEALKEQIVLKKEILRSMPNRPEIDSASSIEELKAFWPAELT